MSLEEDKIQFFAEEVPMPIAVSSTSEIAKWLEIAAANEKATIESLAIVFCNDQYLHEINLQYLNHDTYTDIITFPYSKPPLVSGELYISLDRIKENASIYKVAEKDELHRVMIHGLLHLLGFNDHCAEEKETMRKMEEYYLGLRPFA